MSKKKKTKWKKIKKAPKDGTEILVKQNSCVTHVKWGGEFHNTWVYARGIGFVDHPKRWMHIPK